MVDAKRLLDLLIGASSRPGPGGASPSGLARTAADFIARNPGLAEAALMGLAGVLLGSRQGRGIARGVAGLGGLAVIGGLAYTAFQNYRSGKPPLGAAAGAPAAALPDPAAFDPSEIGEDDALLFARAMVAAATADGRMDAAERTRILGALAQAGIDAGSSRWLERELSDPASVEELVEPIRSPEKAAQLYAAARVAIDPDTMQEREFLRRLAEALDLEPKLRAHIDEAAAGMKSEPPAADRRPMSP